MRVHGVPRRTIALAADGWAVEIIDQRHLPHRFVVERVETAAQMTQAIRDMHVRGAPLIGVSAAYGVCLALRADPSTASLLAACESIGCARPTAVNLGWALAEMKRALQNEALSGPERVELAYRRAAELCEADVEACRALGEHGLGLLQRTTARGGRLRVLTHCNAGWLAAVDWGTALAPIYAARRQGLDVEVWVEETRPRNQGLLTAWELEQEGVPYRLIADNAGGHLMQRGEVDLCIVGTDRTTRNGDVANKIGTYQKALAARDCEVPFWVALPRSTFDASLDDGRAIPIEERDAEELLTLTGLDQRGELTAVRLAPPGTPAHNPAFDLTPARLVTGFVTELGLCSPPELDGIYGGARA
ncbi:MAG TPA: S-methyl-5-thioribose-1-phosphate isomerase [Polyangiaceae bacterium]|nr:S-methyl-5-thioribose-1-phosphate isomerase [Polyangiaceae bacterium]